LSPSLRRFITSTTPDMLDTVNAQFAWRLPPAFDSDAFMKQIELQAGVLGRSRTTIECHFRGVEQAWRADRQNSLVRSFLAAIRAMDASPQPGFLLKSGTSDMNVVAPLWRCPILAYGPGDSALDHTPHEHLSLDEYWRAVQVLTAALREFAQQ
jgi:[amino group carrier protein]-lysine/ornithine hydrolase